MAVSEPVEAAMRHATPRAVYIQMVGAMPSAVSASSAVIRRSTRAAAHIVSTLKSTPFSDALGVLL